jgi:hypothetical protein
LRVGLHRWDLLIHTGDQKCAQSFSKKTVLKRRDVHGRVLMVMNVTVMECACVEWMNGTEFSHHLPQTC